MTRATITVEIPEEMKGHAFFLINRNMNMLFHRHQFRLMTVIM